MTKAKILFPGWRYGPNGEGPELFEKAEDVPEGWTRIHPDNRPVEAEKPHPLDHDGNGKPGGSRPRQTRKPR